MQTSTTSSQELNMLKMSILTKFQIILMGCVKFFQELWFIHLPQHNMLRCKCCIHLYDGGQVRHCCFSNPYCHDGLFGSIQALQDWCYLQQQLEVPLTAEERGIIYCKSSGFVAASWDVHSSRVLQFTVVLKDHLQQECGGSISSSTSAISIIRRKRLYLEKELCCLQ